MSEAAGAGEAWRAWGDTKGRLGWLVLLTGKRNAKMGVSNRGKRISAYGWNVVFYWV